MLTHTHMYVCMIKYIYIYTLYTYVCSYRYNMFFLCWKCLRSCLHILQHIGVSPTVYNLFQVNPHIIVWVLVFCCALRSLGGPPLRPPAAGSYTHTYNSCKHNSFTDSFVKHNSLTHTTFSHATLSLILSLSHTHAHAQLCHTHTTFSHTFLSHTHNSVTHNSVT